MSSNSLQSNPITTAIAAALPLALRTQDGVSLAATHYPAASDQYIALGNATAVPRGFYRRFGEYCQSRGVNMVVADYRGVGESTAMLPRRRGRPTLAGFEMTYADWSAQDYAAVVAFCAQRGAAYAVGHSLGGHAIGQLPQPHLLRAAYLCGTGSGWSGWMPPLERLKVGFMWNLAGPLLTPFYGFHPMKLLGLGDDIPMGVYRDWRRWCKLPNYFFDDPQAAALVAGFARVTLPMAAATSTDDLWALPRSRDAFFKGYSAARVSRIDWEPSALGVAQIGHMGYFRSAVGAQLWPQILAWLGQHGLQLRN